MTTALLVTHLCGVALLFVMISIEVVALVGAPRAVDVAQLRAALYAAPATEVLAPVATVLIVVSGVSMAMTISGVGITKGWVLVSLVVTLILALTGTLVQGRHVKAMHASARRLPEGPLPESLAAMTRDRRWHLTAWGSVGMAFAFLFIMVAEPTLAGAVAGLLVGILVGMGAGSLMLSRASATAAPSSA